MKNPTNGELLVQAGEGLVAYEARIAELEGQVRSLRAALADTLVQQASQVGARRALERQVTRLVAEREKRTP